MQEDKGEGSFFCSTSTASCNVDSASCNIHVMWIVQRILRAEGFICQDSFNLVGSRLIDVIDRKQLKQMWSDLGVFNLSVGFFEE